MMKKFFAELNIMAISIICVLPVVVVQKIMLNVMPKKGEQLAGLTAG